jgi:hypothetical protein
LLYPEIEMSGGSESMIIFVKRRRDESHAKDVNSDT